MTDPDPAAVIAAVCRDLVAATDADRLSSVGRTLCFVTHETQPEASNYAAVCHTIAYVFGSGDLCPLWDAPDAR